MKPIDIPDNTEQISGRLVSRKSFNLINLSTEEVLYLQSGSATLCGPDRIMNKNLHLKLSDLNNWRIKVSQTPKECICFFSYDSINFSSKDIQSVLSLGATSGIADRFQKIMALNPTVQCPGIRILCFGAGDGLEGAIFKSINCSAKIVCTDFNPNVNNYFPVQNVVTKDLLKTFGPQSFDLVFSHHAIEHNTNIQEVMLDIYKLIRPSGIFAGALPVETNPSNKFSNMFENLIGQPSRTKYIALNPTHAWKTDAFGIYDELTNVGFKNVRFYPWTLLRHVDPPRELVELESAVPKNKATLTLFTKKALRFLRKVILQRYPTDGALTVYYGLVSRSAFYRHKRMDELFFVCNK